MDLVIERELHAERATVMRYAGEALEKAVAAWRDLPADRALLQEAQRRLYYLIVQREAVGLYRHHDVFEVYGVPRAWWY